MTAHTRRHQRQQSEQKSRWKLFFALGVFFIALAGLLALFFTYRPWKVECITTLNTYCSDSVQDELEILSQTPLWRTQKHIPQIKKQIIEKHPNIATVEIRRTWLGSIAVHVTEAESLFPLRRNNQDYAVRSNGSLTPSSAPSVPVVLIEENVFSETPPQIHYEAETLQLIKILYDRLQTFTPPIQKIVIKNQNEIILSPEGYGPIYMRLGTPEEVEDQLSTLQAFFHSTTMEKQYAVLDIRFRDVIMK